MSYSNWIEDPLERAGIVEELANWADEVNRYTDEVLDLEVTAPSGKAIVRECFETMKMLLMKNISYGDSALDPIRIFSKADAVQQLEDRIDDKLSRIKNEQSYKGDNDIGDLIGYLTLLKIARNNDQPN